MRGQFRGANVLVCESELSSESDLGSEMMDGSKGGKSGGERVGSRWAAQSVAVNRKNGMKRRRDVGRARIHRAELHLRRKKRGRKDKRGSGRWYFWYVLIC